LTAAPTTPPATAAVASATRDLTPLARDPLDDPDSVISRSHLESAAIVRDFDDRVDGPDAVWAEQTPG
jgi:hypothetical protein